MFLGKHQSCVLFTEFLIPVKSLEPLAGSSNQSRPGIPASWEVSTSILGLE